MAGNLVAVGNGSALSRNGKCGRLDRHRKRGRGAGRVVATPMRVIRWLVLGTERVRASG